jgi:HlyD family secretion protein
MKCSARSGERGFVAGVTVADSRDAYQAALRRSGGAPAAAVHDERLQSAQLAQLRSSANALNTSLDLARASLDALNLRAPVTASSRPSRSRSASRCSAASGWARSTAPGATSWSRRWTNSILAASPRGRRHRGDRRQAFKLRVAKIYPQVQNGAFSVDLAFAEASPPICSAARPCRSA